MLTFNVLLNWVANIILVVAFVGYFAVGGYVCAAALQTARMTANGVLFRLIALLMAVLGGLLWPIIILINFLMSLIAL